MPPATPDRDRRHARRDRRLALWLALLAGGFYAAFVVLSIVRARASG